MISRDQLNRLPNQTRSTSHFLRTLRRRMKNFFRSMKMKLLTDRRRLKKVRPFRRD